MSWVNEDFETIDLSDKQLNRRTVLLAEQLSEYPSSSIAGACKGWKETRGAYWLLSNDKVNCQSVFTPHLDSSVTRMAAQPVALCAQDTTSLDFNGQLIQDTLGPLQYESQRGMSVHPTSTITPGHEPLDVIDIWQWAREFRNEDRERSADGVESQRWIEGYERVAENAASLLDTRCVYLADREADIVELMCRAAELEHLGEVQFELRARRGVKARPVRQTLHKKTLQILNGKKGKGKGKDTLTITSLVASEVGTLRRQETLRMASGDQLARDHTGRRGTAD